MVSTAKHARGAIKKLRKEQARPVVVARITTYLFNANPCKGMSKQNTRLEFQYSHSGHGDGHGLCLWLEINIPNEPVIQTDIAKLCQHSLSPPTMLNPVICVVLPSYYLEKQSNTLDRSSREGSRSSIVNPTSHVDAIILKWIFLCSLITRIAQYTGY